MPPRDPKIPCVYILASQRNGTLYVGVTSDLPGRIWQQQSRPRPRLHPKIRRPLPRLA